MFQKMKRSDESSNIFRNVLLITSVLALFLFIVAFSVFYISDHIDHGATCNSPIPIPVIGILLASLGFFIGTIVYYILSTKFIEEKKQTVKNAELTLQFLPSDERKIVKLLLKEDLTQAKIAKSTGLTRVKVHRVIKRLQEKGVVTSKESKINLKEELKELF